MVQSMPDVSPPKWHIAHVSWFFEAFILKPFHPSYQTLDPAYDYLFNSYYETHGTPFPRPDRGMISRPTVDDVYRYRAHIDRAMAELLSDPPQEHLPEILRRLELGLPHEQQHQELLFMDIKHILAQNPLCPAYRNDLTPPPARDMGELGWHAYPAGVRHIGHDQAEKSFAYDNEMGRHRQFVEAFQIADRPVTNGEFLAFMKAGGTTHLTTGYRMVGRRSRQKAGRHHSTGSSGMKSGITISWAAWCRST
ncbi:SUMF1/EgtB/PvdO family nonheme iron enzyme [Modicisalibacter xianhensis]|uniref:Ergothioneine biosynthesis protein EgtB n=1 Tax=Modicisalibacter xianhensis TaxID=442341 RepID=A0A1I3B259_9GAMM|nr:SUMF1/EgtB/PvdO family nonheme iron enzyme [Halomonas xianhensis]SFH55771.1 ergothioneine biosynthesis protein EgtB [Halomonas xianhensis]